MRYILLWIILIAFSCISKAQVSFSLELKEKTTGYIPARHSGIAFGYGDYIVMMAGRKNGLHGYQPPTAFPLIGATDSIHAWRVSDGALFSADLSQLSLPLSEHLRSSNLLWCKNGDNLYIAGGYGYSSANSDYVTWPRFTVVDIHQLTENLSNGSNIAPAFRQITDSALAITGGNLKYLNGTFYAVFGHRFDGHYSTSHSANFYQKYTNSVRRFNLIDTGSVLQTQHLSSWTDTAGFHRRDYNLAEQIFPDGSEGFTAFSGVFQYNADLPWYDGVDITPAGAVVNSQINQQLNQYHTALMTVHDSALNRMHTVFFGGMSAYYYDTITAQLVYDTLVPFVRTISMITREGDGSISESALSVRMPGLEGTNAEFIPLQNISKRMEGVIRLNSLNGKTLLGHIIGGIMAAEPNVFLQNGDSYASGKVYEVYLVPAGTSSANTLKEPYMLNIYPNPASDFISVTVSGHSPDLQLRAALYSGHGRLIRDFGNQKPGVGGALSLQLNGIPTGVYIIRISGDKYGKAFRFVKK
jgi:hypothetical protein